MRNSINMPKCQCTIILYAFFKFEQLTLMINICGANPSFCQLICWWAAKTLVEIDFPVIIYRNRDFFRPACECKAIVNL